jgi:hypothetical protein
MLLPLGVAALVLTACGAGVASPAHATKAAGKNESVVAMRKHAAQRRAAKLLREFVPPPGSGRIRPAAAAHGILSRSGLPTPGYGELASRHAFWRVRSPLRSVFAYVRRHPVAGMAVGSGVWPSSARQYAKLDFYGRRRLLTVTVARLRGGTVIRVDAGAVWIYPRSQDEMLPAGVQTIDLSSERSSRHVTDPQKVSQIVAWFNALEVVQPGVHVICPLMAVSPPVTFDFRSSSGALLAEATAPSLGPSTQCSPIEFSIGGDRQTPLIGGDFVLRVERLLGVTFGPSVAR